MAVAANKRSVMTLFSGPADVFSHQVRIVLAEKSINVEIEQIRMDNPPKDLIKINPYGTVPTLVDRELILYESRIIMEYLDERFPHPPLMPVYPIARGESRLMMHRINCDWYSMMNIIENNVGNESAIASSKLRKEILEISPLFSHTPFFMSEEFSLVDCYLAPLLWRLPLLGINMNDMYCNDLKEYMKRIFSRDSFLASLTEVEREMCSQIRG
ncbi:stringent starvation protein A [Candidatus Pantoea edessiphila]|uniref:Stringent starvation protein A n=1 Tax=Candidatus Pantoea edessiphila TaxID=2044610 RepID=A0A2P5SY83_9GAMM|nr:stringent starvation protein SspA [Candidatus Pantoea edessiphila]MBK4775653.1 stringent starvation protein A [Pantoea sp. Edef]PPI87299.1 stringent starvation protein A [Candidatus Pantoea edessiphila]